MVAAASAKKNHWIAYIKWLFGVASGEGGALGRRPGAGRAETSRIL